MITTLATVASVAATGGWLRWAVVPVASRISGALVSGGMSLTGSFSPGGGWPSD